MKTLVHGDMVMQCYVTWMGSSSVLTPVSPLFVYETVMQDWSKAQSVDCFSTHRLSRVTSAAHVYVSFLCKIQFES